MEAVVENVGSKPPLKLKIALAGAGSANDPCGRAACRR